MSLVSGQPEIRFNKAGPMGRQGVSYLPKVINVRKTIVAATVENDDFLTLPARSYIVEAMAFVTDACDADTTVTLGVDGDADALINATNFSVQTLGNYYHYQTGYYLAAADTLRIAVGGTPVAGEVQFLISYFELADVEDAGYHFDL